MLSSALARRRIYPAPRTSHLAPILQHDCEHMNRKLGICMLNVHIVFPSSRPTSKSLKSPRKRMTSIFSSYIDELCSFSTPTCEPELLSDRLNAHGSRLKDQRSKLNAQYNVERHNPQSPDHYFSVQRWQDDVYIPHIALLASHLAPRTSHLSSSMTASI